VELCDILTRIGDAELSGGQMEGTFSSPAEGRVEGDVVIICRDYRVAGGKGLNRNLGRPETLEKLIV
jgi:hypothetical protein